MTDHPDQDPPVRRDASGHPSDGATDPGTDPGNGDTAGSPSGTPDSPRPAAPTGFDAALQGEGWDVRRSRRRRSSGPASDTPPAGDSSGSSRSSRSSSSRSSSSRSSRSSRADTPEAAAAPPTPSGGAAPLSDRDRRRTTRKARHTRAVVKHVVVGVLGLGLAWIVVTGLLAAYQLNEARSDLSALRSQISSGGTGVSTTADSLAAHAHHAAVLTRGPAWATLAAIPYVGDPFEAVRGITSQTSELVDAAAPGLVAAAADIDPRAVVVQGAVDLEAVGSAAGPVHTAALAAGTASAGVASLPHSTWLPFVDSATEDLTGQLTELDGTLRTTDQTLQVLPTMLGGDGRARKYFVAFQNNAELRGTGGLPGAFAIVSAQNGKISIEQFQSDTLLQGEIPSGLDFGKAFDQQYKGNLAYQEYLNSNLSPNFPYAAQIWCAMWRNVSGESLDGALTVDPGALSYLLGASGAATAPDGTKVTKDNVVALLQKDVYAKFPQAEENDTRKQYILGVAEAVEKKVLAGTKNGRALLEALARGVSERRIVAYSTDPTAQKVLAGASIGGTVADTDQPYSLLALNNGAAGKLDYYLDRSVTWQRSGCGDTRKVTVTIKLTNNAPASGLPPYVTVRVAQPGIARPADLVPGQNRTVVNYVATEGAQLLGATLDGTPSGAGVFDEVGHPSYQTILEIKPGQTRTWVLELQEPAGTAPVTVVRQPGVTPVQVDVDDRSCH